MDFKSLINKIDSIEKGPQKINESVDLMEKKAVSQAQQKAAGAALSAKRGDTPKSELKAASAEMLDMSEKELEKMAGAEHKGLPKKKTDEALDVNLIKAAQKDQEGKPLAKDDPESRRNIDKPYGSRSDKAVDDAEEDDDEPKTKKSAKKTAKESIDTDRFREKFLSLVEAKKKEAAKTVKGKKADEKMDEGQAPTYNVIDGAGKSVGTFRDGAGFMPGPNAKAKGLKAGPTVPNGYKVDYGRDKEKMDEGKKSGKKKPDADGDGVPDWADKKPGEDDNAAKKTAGKKPAAKKGMTAKQAKYFGKKKTVKESNDIDEFFHYGKGGGFDDDDDDIGSGEGPEDLLDAVESEIRNPGQRIDNLTDVLNATFGSDDSPEFEKARRIIEKYIELVTTADMDHYDDDDDDRTSPAISAMDHDDIQRHIREYDLTDRLQHAAAMLEKIIGKSESYHLRESANAKKKSKKYMKESFERKLSFREMMKLVVESGGQQQIDPLDKALFAWATKVAKNKVGEGMKAEVYAGLVYERMGGRFEMFDVLSETKK